VLLLLLSMTMWLQRTNGKAAAAVAASIADAHIMVMHIITRTGELLPPSARGHTFMTSTKIWFYPVHMRTRETGYPPLWTSTCCRHEIHITLYINS